MNMQNIAMRNNKMGLGAAMALLLVLVQMAFVLPARADEDDLYNAPYYNAQNTPLFIMGTQAQLIGASDTYLAWYNTGNSSARPVLGYDRVKNKLINVGAGSPNTRPVLIGSVVYYSTNGVINGYDLATEKQTKIVEKPGQITQLAADGDLLAYTTDKTYARLISSGSEAMIDLKTTSANFLTVSGKNVFWGGENVKLDPAAPTEYSIQRFNIDARATLDVVRSEANFLGLTASGNQVIFTANNPSENQTEITLYNFDTKKYFGLGKGGNPSINGNLVVYLSNVTDGKVRGFDIDAKRPFQVVDGVNTEGYIFGNKVIWKRSFSNSTGKGVGYYEAKMQPRPAADTLPTKRINEAIPNTMFFYETGHSLRGVFQTYWEKNGGLAQFGLPLSEEFEELNPADSKVYRTQYFERAKFEFHPENQSPNNVLLGLLGSQNTIGREYEEPFLGISKEKAGDGYYFQETGHSINGTIRSYWEKTGGLPVYGFPITEPFQEKNASDGKTYLVQYFERNRLEYHPENAGTKFEVLLGLLGSQVLAGRGWLS